MLWVLLILLAIVLIILLAINVPKRSLSLRDNPSQPIYQVDSIDLYLPRNKYYAWMLVDPQLQTNPLLDFCYPLPSFQTQPQGLQEIEEYDLDTSMPIGNRRLLPCQEGWVNISPYLYEILTKIFTPKMRIVDLSEESADIVRLHLEIEDNYHELLLSLKPLDDSVKKPRLGCRQVGYFTTPIRYKRQTVPVIQRYLRHEVAWRITPEIPISWHSPLQRAIKYWNRHLTACQSNTQLSLDLTPFTGSLADPDINLITLASSDNYLGIGTSSHDPRSGEQLWSRICLDPNVLHRQVEIFPNRREHQDRIVEFTLIHELGHTLGLRHNFAAQVDNYSSYMAYFPAWYPNERGELSFMISNISGRYDALAVNYGYLPLASESLDVVPRELQARIHEGQCLFHTDENVDKDLILSQALRHSMEDGLSLVGNWQQAWKRYRSQLFKDPNNHSLDVKKVSFFLQELTRSTINATAYLGGQKTNYRRDEIIPLHVDDKVIKAVCETLLGESWRLEDLKGNLLVGTDYKMQPMRVNDMHLTACFRILSSCLSPARLSQVKDPAKLVRSLLDQGKRNLLDSLFLNFLLSSITVLTGFTYPPLIQTAINVVIDQVKSKLPPEILSQLENLVSDKPKEDSTFATERMECGCHLDLKNRLLSPSKLKYERLR